MTPDQIMRNMGFPDEATGPYVTELRARTRAQAVRR